MFKMLHTYSDFFFFFFKIISFLAGTLFIFKEASFPKLHKVCVYGESLSEEWLSSYPLFLAISSVRLTAFLMSSE